MSRYTIQYECKQCHSLLIKKGITLKGTLNKLIRLSDKHEAEHAAVNRLEEEYAKEHAREQYFEAALENAEVLSQYNPLPPRNIWGA